MTQNKLISIGVDPGPSGGGISIIDKDLNILELTTAPYMSVQSKTKIINPKVNKTTGRYEKTYKHFKWTDYNTLPNIYKKHLKNDIIYTVEKVFVKKGEGEQSSFIFGQCTGVHLAQKYYLNPIQFQEVPPTVWKPEFGLDGDKEKSIILANSIFEKQLLKKLGKVLKFQKTNSNKNVDMAEALLLSLYGLKIFLNEKGR